MRRAHIWLAGAAAALVGFAAGVAQDDEAAAREALEAFLAVQVTTPTGAVLAALDRAEIATGAAKVEALQAALDAEDKLDATARDPALEPRAAILERLAEAKLAVGDTAGALAAVREAEAEWTRLFGEPSAERGVGAGLAEAFVRLAALAERAGDGAYAADLRARAALSKSAIKPGSPGDGVAEVTVFYATSRAVETPKAGRALAAQDFTGRPIGDGELLNYGRLVVSVPEGLDFGEVRAPSLWRFEFRADPERHVILADLQPIGHEDAFFAEVADVVADSDERQALVFVHGYRNTFAGAARRAAKLAYDLRVDGAPILYSWPSSGDLQSYVSDRGRCTQTEFERFARFLDGVVDKTGAERVDVIAHSMGNCLVVKALDELAKGAIPDVDGWTAPTPKPLAQVVLGAPDLARDDFTAAVAGRLSSVARGVTVYASDKDAAIGASRLIWKSARLGQASPPLSRPGVAFVDASAAPSDAFNHLHFAAGALDDLRALIWKDAGLERRCTIEQSAGAAVYRPTDDVRVCDAIALRQAAFHLRQWSDPGTTLRATCGAIPKVQAWRGTVLPRVCAQAQILSGVVWEGE